jgi:hypothetical protein
LALIFSLLHHANKAGGLTTIEKVVPLASNRLMPYMQRAARPHGRTALADKAVSGNISLNVVPRPSVQGCDLGVRKLAG